MSVVDNFDKVMAVTENRDGYLVIPEGVMYNGKEFKGQIGNEKLTANIAMTWHNAVRQEYARQESEAAESRNKDKAVRGHAGRGDPQPADKERVGPAVQATEQTVEEILQARLESEEVAVESLTAEINGLNDRLYKHVEEADKLRKLIEVLT